MEKKGILLVVSGPSGAGKGTICKAFLEKNPEVKLSISATTRLPREGEVDGVNYYFIDKDKFKSMIDKEEFMEHAYFFENHYGTPKKPVLENLENGKDVVLEIDILGAMQVKERCPEAVMIFILPPSIEELKHRITGRGTETPEQVKKRLSRAMEEIRKIEEYSYFIVNDDVKRAVEEMEAIVLSEKNKVDRYKKELIRIYEEEI